MRHQRIALKTLLVALLALIISPTIALAQGLEGKTISSIAIRYNGAQTVTRQRILDNMATKAGQPYQASKIDDDIQNLVARGLVDDVDVFADDRGKNVGLVFQVDTKSSLAGVGFQGNTKFSNRELLKAVDLTVGSAVSDDIILKGKNKILERYLRFNYPDVRVDYAVRKTNRPGYSDLIYVVREGMQSVVRDIRFRGNRAISSTELRNVMKTKQKGVFSIITKSGNIDPDKVADDRELIIEHYKNKGYLAVQVSDFQRAPVGDGKKVDLILDINEGSKYTVNQVAFSRMSVFTPQQLSPDLLLAAGKAYSGSKVKEDITMIRSYYGSKGYADARVKPVITNVGPTTVNVTYQITEGARYKVGRISIVGNNITQDGVIRREIPLKPGDNFNTVDVDTTRKRLKNLNYFSQVIASPSTSSQPGYRDLDLSVEEKKTGSIGFGLGFSSIDSIVGYINIEETNFDITKWSNSRGGKRFRGGGQRFGMDLRLGTKRRDFKIALTEPWFLGQRLALGGELYYQESLYYSNLYDQRNVGGSIFLRKPVGKKAYIKAAYRLEQINIDLDQDLPVGSVFNGFGGDFLRSQLSLNYVYDSRDALINPRSGEKIDLGIAYSGLGGDVETFGFSATASKHWNLWWDSIFTLRGELNVVEGDNIPVFELQKLGGSRNLRGFDFADVGPRDAATGEVYGGQTSGYATAEITFPIVDRVRFATFVDAGFVNKEAFDFNPSDLFVDAGVGLRLDLPVGPLAIDYGIPVSSPDDKADKGGQFNFYINYAF